MEPAHICAAGLSTQAGMGCCQLKARTDGGENGSKLQWSNSNPGEKTPEPSKPWGEFLSAWGGMPGYPPATLGAKANTCCENRHCDSHTCKLPFAQPAHPREPSQPPPAHPHHGIPGSGFLPGVPKELGPIDDCPSGVSNLWQTSSLSKQ